MSILIFAIIVIIVAALLVWAVDQIPMTNPLSTIVRVAIILIAVLVIVQRAGLV